MPQGKYNNIKTNGRVKFSLVIFIIPMSIIIIMVYCKYLVRQMPEHYLCARKKFKENNNFNNNKRGKMS